jgi:ferrous iron transport protein B
MGFGCNVPAIMATRTLDNRKDRIITIMILPFMSCSARLPVFVLLISAFFTDNQGLVLLSVYAVGVLVAILTAILFRRLFFKEDEVPFVMELPPYRMPTMRNTLRHMWDKSVQYLSKMGTVILIASILIWALGYFPQDVDYSKDYEAELQMVENNSSLTDEQREGLTAQIMVEQESEHTEKSYIGQLGHAIEPVIAPLGYDWKIGVSIITGLAAKEIVVGSMGVLYQSDLEADENSANLQEKLKTQKFTSGDKVGQLVFTPVVAYSFMIFVLLYFPCFAALAAIRREAGTKWAALSAVYTTGVAWVVAFIVTQVGSLI